MFRPIDDDDRKARDPLSIKKMAKKPFKGFSDLKKSEVQLKEDLIAIKAKLVATETAKRDLEEALEKAQYEIQTLNGDLDSLQREVQDKLDRQENKHIAEIEEIGIVNAEQIEQLAKQLQGLAITRRCSLQ